jgi:hypothetical protein
MNRPPDEKEPAAGCHRWRALVSMALWTAAITTISRHLRNAKFSRARRAIRRRLVLETLVDRQREEG